MCVCVRGRGEYARVCAPLTCANVYERMCMCGCVVGRFFFMQSYSPLSTRVTALVFYMSE